MTFLEAIEICEKFTNSIKDLRPDSIVQSSKSLPYTKVEIKQALLICGEEMVKSNKITKELAEQMMESYGIIDSFFVEDEELINKKYREYIIGLKNGVITDFRMPNPFGEPKQVFEYFTFLDKCLFKIGKEKLFIVGKDVLGTFAYNLLQDDIIKNNDVKLAIKLVNSSLTRKLDFPGKKNEEESIFI